MPIKGRTSPTHADQLDEPAGVVPRLRQELLQDFDPAYVDNVILPYYQTRIYLGERLSLPMLDTALTKENAMGPQLWGLLSDSWRPNPDDGITVFLQDLEKRGAGNLRKKIYLSAV